MASENRIRKRRYGPESHLPDSQHLASVLLHQRIRHQPGFRCPHVPYRQACRRLVGPYRRSVRRQEQPEMGQIPLMAHTGRNPSCRTGHPLLLEPVQRFSRLCIHNIRGHEHVLHIGERAVWRAQLIPYKRHRRNHYPDFDQNVHGELRSAYSKVTPDGDCHLRADGR